MKVIRHDPWSGCVRVAAYAGMAFFTGHVSKDPGDTQAQTLDLLGRYDEMIARFGYRKEHLACAHAFLSDIAQADRFDAALRSWCAPGHAPVRTVVGAPPSGTFKVELALYFAYPEQEKGEVDMQHHSGTDGFSQVVIHNGFAYFSGICADDHIKGMRAETEDILRKYEALFAQHGLLKADIINSNCYVTDMDTVDAYGDPWCAWAGEKAAPAGVCVKAGLPGDRTVMIQLVVAAPQQRGGQPDGR